MSTKYQIIVDIWERMERDVVGAPELELIQQAVAVRFGTTLSLASIARTLADHGAQLGHPEILIADVKWRERNSLFTAEELTLANLSAALALIDKIERLRREFEDDQARLENLRQSVRELKGELGLHVSSELAQELEQWLTIWLQSPQIFPEWLALRRNTTEFRERFGN